MNKTSKRTIPDPNVPDELVELENHFILRLPVEQADQVRLWLQDGGSSFKDKLSISFQPDMRHAQVRVDKMVFNGSVLVDLPAVVETYKTLDKKTLYKVADVGQMLICKETQENDANASGQKPPVKDPNSSLNESDPQIATKQKKKDKQYQWGHGITPPLKNVRKRRFRKTLKKKYMDAPELEKELKRLLREDMEAASVRWEIVTAEQELQQKLQKHQQKLLQQQPTMKSTNAGAEQPMSTIHVEELFGGALSSSSDDDSGSDGDGDSELDDSGRGSQTIKIRPESVTVASVEDDEEAEGRAMAQQLMMPEDEDTSSVVDSETLRMRIVELQSELIELEKSRKTYEVQLAYLEHPLLKERIEQEVVELQRRDKQIREEVDALKREIQRKS